MFKSKTSKHIAIIFLTLAFVVASYFYIRAAATPVVQFTADVNVSLTGLSNGDLQIASSSECVGVDISGTSLTVDDVTDSSSFIFKTPEHTNGLSLTPSGGVLDVVIDSSDVTSDDITEWTLTAAGGVDVAHVVGVGLPNEQYTVKVDGTVYNAYTSSAGSEVSFTYAGAGAAEILTIESGDDPPSAFSLISPANNTTSSDLSYLFTWNATGDLDINHYKLFIDSTVASDNISGTTATASVGCGAHTWFVRAVDNGSNTTDSSSFNLTVNCGGGLPPDAFNPPTVPEPSEENPDGGFTIIVEPTEEPTIPDTPIIEEPEIIITEIRTITLEFNAGPDVDRMAISEDPEFKYAPQEKYSDTMEYELSEEPGRKIIYVKFFTRYGIPSEIISIDVILLPRDEEEVPSDTEEPTDEGKPVITDKTTPDKNEEDSDISDPIKPDNGIEYEKDKQDADKEHIKLTDKGIAIAYSTKTWTEFYLIPLLKSIKMGVIHVYKNVSEFAGLMGEVIKLLWNIILSHWIVKLSLLLLILLIIIIIIKRYFFAKKKDEEEEGKKEDN